MYNVELREVLRSALAAAPPGSFSASPATSLPLLKGRKKKKDLLVPKGTSVGRRGRRERFTNTEKKENYLLYYALVNTVLIPNDNVYCL